MEGTVVFQDAISSLKRSACFPAIDDDEDWYFANSLYAPYRAEAFSSQASVLDFRNMARLNRDLLKKLNVALEPETSLVINHLRHCVAKITSTFHHVSDTQREIERRRLFHFDVDRGTVHLHRKPEELCEIQSAFLDASAAWALCVHHSRQPRSVQALIQCDWGKECPEGRDYVDILLDIVAEYFEQSKPVTGVDRSVYEACLIGIAASDEREELGASDIRRLQEAPS
ncbi:hypothetical protein [Pseudomonas aeruginosa]|uniref:hypothetical protein n=1 Tax=Pseudomonas aeruginosa TaxID=287 RepID=UPI000F17B8E2|nr:hypothetical protein [Pseudomonas aeruginosa]VCW38723.1 hypothetical protein BANRA_05756 [Pseudomonas aeruginosa]